MEGWDAPLTDWIEEIKEYTNAEVVQMSKEALERIKARTPVASGQLRDGWQLEQMIEDGIMSVEIINDIEYVLFAEYGTDKYAGKFMVEQTLNELAEGTI